MLKANRTDRKKVSTPVIIGGISAIALTLGLLYWLQKKRSQETEPPKPKEKKVEKPVEKKEEEDDTSRIIEEEEVRVVVVKNEDKKEQPKPRVSYQPPPELDDTELVSKRKPDKIESLRESQFGRDSLLKELGSKAKSHRKTASEHNYQLQLDEESTEVTTQIMISPSRPSERNVMRSPQRGMTMITTKKLFEEEDEYEPYSDPEV